jgi:hypothetical protein
MTQYDNTNRGTLSRNDRKTEDKHPDFSGQINVDGVDYWLSGWVKERKDGSGKFFSLGVRRKEDKPAKAAKPAASVADMTDDIPF